MKHILMVDDVATNLKCAGEVLKDKYELSKAKSGKKALEMLKERKPDSEKPYGLTEYGFLLYISVKSVKKNDRNYFWSERSDISSFWAAR